MATLREALLPVVDTLRGIPGDLGLRLFTVSIVVRTWTGKRAGLGKNIDSPTYIRVALGTFPAKVVHVTTRDIIASGGLYTDEDLKVGPITPPFAGSDADGSAINVFDPPPGSSPSEIFFNVIGPGYPPEGAWFKKFSQDTHGNFRYTFVIRKSAEIP